MGKMNEVVSYIKLSETVNNKDHKFGETNKYQPCYIESDNGTIKAALFTEHEIETAIIRAKKNPEDMGDRNESILEELSAFFNF
jgi:hypothetical protein